MNERIAEIRRRFETHSEEDRATIDTLLAETPVDEAVLKVLETPEYWGPTRYHINPVLLKDPATASNILRLRHVIYDFKYSKNERKQARRELKALSKSKDKDVRNLAYRSLYGAPRSERAREWIDMKVFELQENYRQNPVKTVLNYAAIAIVLSVSAVWGAHFVYEQYIK